MGEFQTLGLSIHLFRPSHTFNATTHKSTPTLPGALLADLSLTVSSYQHSVGIVGGFLSASFTVTANLPELERWYDQAVGAHVMVTDNAGVIVWEGFVDSVDIAVGGQTIKRGPLMDVGNSVLLTYSLQDTTTSPPSSGNNTLSTGAENTASMAVYGVRQQIVNAGSCTATQATQYLNLWMIENSWPRTTQDIDLSGGGGMTASFSCLGYYSMLDYYYHNVTNAAGSITGTVNLSTKIASILDYDWAGYFSSSNASIAANTTPVAAYEGEWTEAGSLIKAMVDMGDSSYNRYKFMVGPDRYVTYAAVAATTPRYYRAFTDPRQSIWEANGPVKPWAVRPGEWARLTDWLAARDEPSSFYTDPRYMLIEQVSYTAPWGLSLSAGRSDRLDQLIAQLGLEGKK